MQIAPSTIDPDRGCKVACQDEYLPHRFYLVNGEQGFFPFGTKCSRNALNDNRYCVNGKCLQFDERNIPLVESHISLALYRSRRSINTSLNTRQNLIEHENDEKRRKRNFLFFEPVNITENLTRDSLQNIITKLLFTDATMRGKTFEPNTIQIMKIGIFLILFSPFRQRTVSPINKSI